MKSYHFLFLLTILVISCNKKVAKLATLTTSDVFNISDSTATINGVITDIGNSEITECGVVWSVNQNPTIDDNSALDNINNDNTISIQISGLNAATNYFVRTYAKNEAGVSYGNEVTFNTTYTIVSNPGQPLVDINGNTYETIELGNGQIWMAENLRASSCSNGTTIPNIVDDTIWVNLTTPGYSFYENNANYDIPFGKLYNWNTVISCDVCPSGWRVPNLEDFNAFVDYLDPNASGTQMVNGAGSKMKIIGTQYWVGSNSFATNESGFSAIPGGSRMNNGALV